MFDDSNVFKLPETNYTPLNPTFLEEPTKKKIPLKLIIAPIVLLALIPTIFFAYQGTRASTESEDEALFRQIEANKKKAEAKKVPTVVKEAHISSVAAKIASPSAKAAPTASVSANIYNVHYYDISKAKNPQEADEINPEPDIKTRIEGALKYLKFPTTFLNDYSIVFVNHTPDNKTYGISKNSKQVIVPGLMKDDKGAADPEKKLIILNSAIRGDELEAVFMHALGNLIITKLTPDEFKAYMSSRNMQKTVIDAWYAYWKDDGRKGTTPGPTEWAKLPEEDFAEVYKVIYGNKKPTPNWAIKTSYGPVTATQRIWMLNNVSSKIK